MKEELIEFEKVLDLACKSKFIMVDKRISDILKCIASTESIYELIKKTLINFDFAKELKIATSIEGHFSMPNDDVRAVALTFCILNAVDDKKLEITQLLANNFTDEDPYAKFCDQVFLRFKTAVLSLLGNDNIDAIVEEKKETQISDQLLDRAAFLASQMEEYVKPNAKKYLNCFAKSLSLRDREFIGVFFKLLSENTTRHGKILLRELGDGVGVIINQ